MVYEPVELAQDFRTFEFMSPWEGADYPLPGDEKAAVPPVLEVKTTEKPAQTGSGEKTDAKAAEKVADAAPAKKVTRKKAPSAPNPTEDRPARKPRAKRTTGDAE